MLQNCCYFPWNTLYIISETNTSNQKLFNSSRIGKEAFLAKAICEVAEANLEKKRKLNQNLTISANNRILGLETKRPHFGRHVLNTTMKKIYISYQTMLC